MEKQPEKSLSPSIFKNKSELADELLQKRKKKEWRKNQIENFYQKFRFTR